MLGGIAMVGENNIVGWNCIPMVLRAQSHGHVDGKPSSRSSHVFCTPKEIFPESCYCGIPHATCNELSDRSLILSIHLILLRSWWNSHLGCLSLNIPSDSDACDGLLAAANFVIAAGFPSSALRLRVTAESEPPKHRYALSIFLDEVMEGSWDQINYA